MQKQKMFAKFYEKASEQNNGAANQSASSTKAKKRHRLRKGNHEKSVESSSSSAFGNAAGAKRTFSSALVPPPPAPSKRPRRQVPSEEAIALSAKLKVFSSQKRLDEALEFYWHESNDSIRDGHHACIVVDCSARCGSIAVSTVLTQIMTLAASIVSNFFLLLGRRKDCRRNEEIRNACQC